MDLPDEASLWALIAFTVLVSTVVHGLSAGMALERVTGETSAMAGEPKQGAARFSRPIESNGD
jgi:hypothetical protein